MIRITREVIEPADLLEHVRTTSAGAVVLFLGTVREMTGTQRTEWLEYDAYPEMAQATLAELIEGARRRWPVLGCAVVHRLGRLELGEVAVAVAVSSPHRGDAFQAGQWIMDTIKEQVPIWKCENGPDGSRQWVHPAAREEERTS
jgi:molybdopterin synthase catalytic subunit